MIYSLMEHIIDHITLYNENIHQYHTKEKYIMAIFKKIAAQGKYQDNQAIPDLIAYITRRDKTPSIFIGGVETDRLLKLIHRIQ